MPHVWEMAGMERRYSVPPSVISEPLGRAHPTEDLHAWSIYRQNLNSDFTDSALGSQEKSPLPYGNFQLRESTVHSILSHPRYGPHSRGGNNELGVNMFTYLKFGLPRVFPPIRGARDGSSGYDSSDDGVVSEREARFLRSRSDPDFRNHLIRRQDGGSEVAWWKDRRTRSSSEANLLNQDMYSRNEEDASRNGNQAPSRRTMAASKADSQISVVSHLSRPHIGVFGGVLHTDGLYGRDTHLLNEQFFPKDTALYIGHGIDNDRVVLKYPHLQIRGLTYEEQYKLPGKFGSEKRWLRIFEGISFEVRGGELLGVMATSEYEGTTLLNVLADSQMPNRYRLRGDVIVNGTRVTMRMLKDRLAYVQQDCSFAEDMSVRQTLLFTSLLQEPGNQSRTFDTKGRVNALIEDLGLGLVKHTRVKNLTMSEKRRLNVACRLLLDTDVVLLDQPTKGMDIFDTFFLVEYLRQWASRGRIVITTFQPPTYEIFTMLTKVALLSTGRLMYFGKRREMLPYFAFIEYPCPAYKNPADYYLDLVTLDNLSPEAMLESSQRVDLLAETFRRRQEILSDPGPPGIPPVKIKRANILVKMLALWIRALIYMFPYNLITFSRNVAIAAAMSVLIGAIFYNVRLGREQEHVQDRLAFHFVMMGVAVWPLILLTISEVWSFKDVVTRDVSDGLYSKGAYAITKMQYSFPAATGVFLAYLIPAYCMAGLKNEVDNVTFSVYIGYMLLYLFSVRALAAAMACTFNSRHLSATITGLVMSFVSLCSGWPVHLQDLSVLWYWLQWVSPMRWVMEQLVLWDFHRTSTRNVTFICSHNPTVVQEQVQGDRALPSLQPRIVVRAECGLHNGSQAVTFMAFREDWTPHTPVLITCGFWAFWQLWAVLAFIYRLQAQKKSRNRILRTFQ